MIASTLRTKALHVLGNNLVNDNNEKVILRGASLFWSQWGEKYYHSEVIHWLVSDWKINVIRIPIAVEHGGYLDHPEKELRKLFEVVDAALKCQIYIIIDWHCHNIHLEGAKLFFQTVSKKYTQHPLIIYEVFNEPNATYEWNKDLLPYYSSVIEVIRSNSPNAIIVLGTEKYCQGIEKKQADTIRFHNVMYTMHFYAASHKQKLRKKLIYAINNKIPIFVSEYGTCESCGDGFFSPHETKKWWKILDKNKISHIVWAVNDKSEAASLLKPSASPHGYWSSDDLTPSGKLLRRYLRHMHNQTENSYKGVFLWKLLKMTIERILQKSH